jgi:hypothetical protein
VVFGSEDPRQLVRWLCNTYGLQAILQEVAQYRPTDSAEATPTKRAYKKRGAKKGSKRGAKKGATKNGRRKGGNRGASSEGHEVGNP